MSDTPTDLLSRAIGALVGQRGQAPKADSEQEGEHSHSYSLSCPACKASIQISSEDLEQYRTDDEAGATGNEGYDQDEDDDSDHDDSDDLTEEEKEEFAKDRKTALAAALSKAAQPTKPRTSKANNSSKVAALKAKYADRELAHVDQLIISKGLDPFED